MGNLAVATPLQVLTCLQNGLGLLRVVHTFDRVVISSVLLLDLSPHHQLLDGLLEKHLRECLMQRSLMPIVTCLTRERTGRTGEGTPLFTVRQIKYSFKPV